MMGFGPKNIDYARIKIDHARIKKELL